MIWYIISLALFVFLADRGEARTFLQVGYRGSDHLEVKQSFHGTPQAWPDQICDQSGRLDPAPSCRGCSLAQCRSACAMQRQCRYYVFNPNVAPSGGYCMMYSSCLKLRGHAGFTVHLSLKSTSEVQEQQTVAQVPLEAAMPIGISAASPADIDNCTPQCSWQCQAAKCDQKCTPNCSPPACQTRCSSMANTQGCKMECEKPVCAVVCAHKACGKANCPMCQTQCSQPMCKLACPSGAQNCRNVCQHPRCKWDCAKPLACPMPACHMACDPPKSCATLSIDDQLPPVQSGETVVQGFITPVLLQQQLAAQRAGGKVDADLLHVMVPITKAVSVPGSKVPRLVNSTVKMTVR